MPAEEAERMGMVWQVVDDAALMDEATRRSPDAWPPAPTLFLRRDQGGHPSAATNTLDQQLDLERDSQRGWAAAPTSKEGVAAFLAKRPAHFTGR